MFTEALFTTLSVHTPAGLLSSHSTLNIERKQMHSWFGSLYHFYVYGLWIFVHEFLRLRVKATGTWLLRHGRKTHKNKDVPELVWVALTGSAVSAIGIGWKFVCIDHHDPANQEREWTGMSVNKVNRILYYKPWNNNLLKCRMMELCAMIGRLSFVHCFRFSLWWCTGLNRS